MGKRMVMIDFDYGDGPSSGGGPKSCKVKITQRVGEYTTMTVASEIKLSNREKKDKTNYDAYREVPLDALREALDSAEAKLEKEMK